MVGLWCSHDGSFDNMCRPCCRVGSSPVRLRGCWITRHRASTCQNSWRWWLTQVAAVAGLLACIGCLWRALQPLSADDVGMQGAVVAGLAVLVAGTSAYQRCLCTCWLHSVLRTCSASMVMLIQAACGNTYIKLPFRSMCVWSVSRGMLDWAGWGLMLRACVHVVQHGVRMQAWL